MLNWGVDINDIKRLQIWNWGVDTKDVVIGTEGTRRKHNMKKHSDWGVDTKDLREAHPALDSSQWQPRDKLWNMNGNTNLNLITKSSSIWIWLPAKSTRLYDYNYANLGVAKQANVRRGGIRMFIRNIYCIVEELVLRLCCIEPIYTIFMRD